MMYETTVKCFRIDFITKIINSIHGGAKFDYELEILSVNMIITG